MIGGWAHLLTGLAVHHPRKVVGVSLGLAAISIAFLLGHLSIRTDLDALLSKDLPSRRTEAALNAAFVSEGDDLTLIVKATTPELADAAADRLSERLARRKDLFLLVQRPLGGSYLEHQALLFLAEKDVRSLTAQLIRAQPLLGPLAADPSLRGLMHALTASLTDAEHDPHRLTDLQPYVTRLDASLAKPKTALSWRAMLSGGEPRVDGTSPQAIIILTPKINYDAIAPAAAVQAEVASAIKEMQFETSGPAAVSVTATGAVAMQADELANLSEATGPIALGAGVLILVILFLGVRSVTMIAAIVATVLTGLFITSAAGLVLYHEFTLISVAFLPLFVGLGVDFAIQYAIRSRAEQSADDSPGSAFLATARTAGPSVVLAAAATGLGFLAFVPTSYKGVSELGGVAALGMAVAALLALLVLPAWLTLFGSAKASSEGDLRVFQAFEDRVQQWKRPILGLALGLGLGGCALLVSLRLDFDPISLRNPMDASVRLYKALTHDPDLTPNRLQILAPSLAEGRTLARHLRTLSSVGEVTTVESFIPEDQTAKLAMIADANVILDPSLSPFDMAGSTTREDTRRAVSEAAARLAEVAARGDPQAPEVKAAQAFALRLKALATAPDAVLDGAEKTLTASLPAALDQVRASLTPQASSITSLPKDLRDQWLTPDGRALVDVAPRGDAADPKVLKSFIDQVTSVAPEASGSPVSLREAARTILGAFLQALTLSTLAIIALLALVLRSARLVALTLGPVALSGILTLASLPAFGEALNLENLIALPLLLGIGVSFNIYTVMAWRDGVADRLRASLGHAILFSALTTGASFAALALSAHPGTASLGRLLLVALGWTLISALVFQPALLASFKAGRKAKPVI